MRIVTSSTGKRTLKITKAEWERIGVQAGFFGSDAWKAKTQEVVDNFKKIKDIFFNVLDKKEEIDSSEIKFFKDNPLTKLLNVENMIKEMEFKEVLSQKEIKKYREFIVSAIQVDGKDKIANDKFKKELSKFFDFMIKKYERFLAE